MASTRRNRRWPAKQASAPLSTSRIAAGPSYACGSIGIGGGSDFAPALERLVHRHFVGVFEVAADGQAHRDARDADAERLQQAREINRRRLALDVGIGGENHFGHAAADPLEQALDF